MEKFYFLRRRSAAGGILPLYHIRPQTSRKMSYSERWIHIIPVIVFLCMFILWWFSAPDNMVLKKGGGSREFSEAEKPRSLNDTRVDFAFLATAAARPPYASITQSHHPVENRSAAVPVDGEQKINH